jgi:hypothetical protein
MIIIVDVLQSIARGGRGRISGNSPSLDSDEQAWAILSDQTLFLVFFVRFCSRVARMASAQGIAGGRAGTNSAEVTSRYLTLLGE